MELYQAIASNDFENFLIHLPKNANSPTHKDYYPFITCAYFNRVDMMDHMMKETDINIWVTNSYKSNALHVAVYMCNMDCVRYLCKHCSSLCMGIDRWGRTPLFSATKNGGIEMVKLLVEAGSDLTVRDNYGRNAEEHTQYENIKKYLKNYGSSCSC